MMRVHAGFGGGTCVHCAWRTGTWPGFGGVGLAVGEGPRTEPIRPGRTLGLDSSRTCHVSPTRLITRPTARMHARTHLHARPTHAGAVAARQHRRLPPHAASYENNTFRNDTMYKAYAWSTHAVQVSVPPASAVIFWAVFTEALTAGATTGGKASGGGAGEPPPALPPPRQQARAPPPAAVASPPPRPPPRSPPPAPPPPPPPPKRSPPPPAAPPPVKEAPEAAAAPAAEEEGEEEEWGGPPEPDAPYAPYEPYSLGVFVGEPVPAPSKPAAAPQAAAGGAPFKARPPPPGQAKGQEPPAAAPAAPSAGAGGSPPLSGGGTALVVVVVVAVAAAAGGAYLYARPGAVRRLVARVGGRGGWARLDAKDEAFRG
jgi:hypothetical protein